MLVYWRFVLFSFPFAFPSLSHNITPPPLSVYGIGASLESATAYNLAKLSPDVRRGVLEKLYSTEEGIGFNLMRITIGTADYCPAPFYSYDDNDGKEDLQLEKFSTEMDEKFIIPAIQESIAIAGEDLKFFASPWSGPGWMKSSGVMEGGTLLRKYHEQYTKYLAKMVTTYRDKYGIQISAITPQNEPLANQTYPSTLLSPEEERDLIRNHLGKSMKDLGTEIWCFDHNWETLFYPMTVLKDPEAFDFVGGTGFHGYVGQPSAMTQLHDQFPDKSIYFTEGSMFKIRGARQIVDIFNNWSRSYSAWVTMLDTNLQPNSGPFVTNPTMIQIDADTLEVIYNDEYYIYGQFSKFVPRGSIRIASNLTMSSSAAAAATTTTTTTPTTTTTVKLSNVAFLVPQTQTISLVVVNEEETIQTLDITYKGNVASVGMPPKSVATFVWAL